MSDSSTLLWESELLRARQWLASSHRDKQHERDRLFQCVKTHIGYKDHQHSMQSEHLVSEDEDDGALDFLGDLDAADMSALLQAEAAKATISAPRLDIAMPLESTVPSTGNFTNQLEMPSNLVSPKLKPRANSKALGTTTTMTSSAMLGSDFAVNALMQDLHVDVTSLHREECKTEESTPPHLMTSFGANCKAYDCGMSLNAGKKSEQLKHMLHVTSKSPRDPHEKRAATRDKGMTVLDDHATEMLSWVSGYRDPDVIRRKETMRRRRKPTNRYGVPSEEEHLQIQLQVKKITCDSDSRSEDDFSSDYSPAEDDEVPEQEEPEVVDLLSDDYLDSDEDKRKKKRLRQVTTTITATKKRTRLRKPVVTRKVYQTNPSGTTSPLSASVLKSPLSCVADYGNSHTSATTKKAPGDSYTTGESNLSIKRQSSDDELENADGDAREAVINQLTVSSGASSDRAEPEATMELTISRLETPLPDKNLLEKANPEDFVSAISAINTMHKTSSQSADTEQNNASRTFASLIGKIDTVTQSAGASDAEADISDTGTIDFEGEDLSTVAEENYVERMETAHEVVNYVGTGELKEGETHSSAANSIDGIQLCPQAQEEDDSEAETIILDDEEPMADDLGLDCSDNNEITTKKVSNVINTTRGQSDATGSKKNAKPVGMEVLFSRDRKCDISDAKDKVLLESKTCDGLDASKAGVQQFFDFTPLKLKLKSRGTSLTAFKPLPVHANADTHVEETSCNAENATRDREILSDNPVKFAKVTKPAIGSNGLRPCKKPFDTTRTLKGKHAATRRSTKMLDVESTLKSMRGSKDHIKMASTEVTGTTNDLDDIPLSILAKEMAKKYDGKPQARYLSYIGARKTEDAPSHVKETPRIVPKSRFGGGGGHGISLAAPNGQHNKNDLRRAYSQEPQLSIYDALHMDGHESSNNIREGVCYKRSSQFKKMQEVAAQNGASIVKSRRQETDWDKVPIPKKKKGNTKSKPLQTTDKPNIKAKSKCQKKSSKKVSGPSYYGPQGAKLAKLDSSSRKRRSWEHSTCDDRKKNGNASIHCMNRSYYDRRDDCRRRASSRSSSRSLSPRGRDYKSSSRHSRSKSRSRDRFTERDFCRTERLTYSSCDQDRANGGESFSLNSRNISTGNRSSESSELSEKLCNGKVGDNDRCAKKQKTSHSIEVAASPDAVATFDHEADSTFVSDSDDEEIGLIRESEDIRFDLDSVSVDESLMSRQVYVSGVNPTVFAEQIEEDFAPFGVAIDKETGFPAIDVFSCQRNHLGRGDACVTFDTEKGAHEAVEELNAKNIKNSMIRVRRMDAHTQRILKVQFQLVRDTWRCTGAQCRADVSIWNAKCDKCGQKRVYGPSNIKIEADSWLCSLCFTANESISTNCHGCMKSLPEVDRSTFYTS